MTFPYTCRTAFRHWHFLVSTVFLIMQRQFVLICNDYTAMTQSYITCNCDTVLTEASGSSLYTDIMGVLPRFSTLELDIGVFCVLK
jgi:hypothetical protein